jgi:hypothetical protein
MAADAKAPPLPTTAVTSENAVRLVMAHFVRSGNIRMSEKK